MEFLLFFEPQPNMNGVSLKVQLPPLKRLGLGLGFGLG